MLISDWSSDVCSSDLAAVQPPRLSHPEPEPPRAAVSTFVTPLLPKPRDIRMTARGRVMRQAPVAVTRFAPSPTGRLHLGHALSAVLSHDLARADGGRFILRIEDIDPGRCRAGFVGGIIEAPQWRGLVWDGEVVRTSARRQERT